MRPSAWPLAGLLTLAVAGCAIPYPGPPETPPSPISTGSSGAGGPTSGAGSPTPAATAAPSGPSAEIEIDITGGQHAGSYRAVTPGGCDSEPAQNMFSVAYASDVAPDGFVALHLVLSDAAKAQSDQSNDFVADISVGGAGAGISYAVDPRQHSGTGTALLEITPVDTTLELSAKMPDGAQIDLTVICGTP